MAIPTGRAFCSISAVITTPEPETVSVESISLDLDYLTPIEGGGPIAGTPSGLTYANYDGDEEWAAVYSPGAFSVPGEKVEVAYDDWVGANLAPTPLAAGAWVLWAYDGKIFYTSPVGGLWYREIGGGAMVPVYLDVESPGSSGAATFVADANYLDIARFDPGADTVVWTEAPSGTTVTPVTDRTGFVTTEVGSIGLLTVEVNAAWAQAVVTLGAAKSAAGADAMGIILMDKTAVQDGYTSVAANNFVILENSATTATGSLPIQVTGRVNVKGGNYFGWVDLSGVPDAIKNDIKKITIRFGLKPVDGMLARVSKLLFGGIRYKDTDWPGSTQFNTGSVEYAYNVTEGPTIGQAALLSVTSVSHLGTRLNAGAPYMGATTVITVPKGDAPFTGAATIHLYRKQGSVWQQIATGPNTDNLIYTDTLQDSTISGDTSTYPVVTLNFDAPTSSFSGQVDGIICGCAWKGSNIYSSQDGNIYGSRSQFFDDVLWDNVVKTNDVGSDDLGPPRTATLSDDLKSPALALVPGESLYALTAREVYVFIPGETFATSSFPRKVDGARGVLGVRAACVYGDACLYGAVDGLWLVKKSTFDSSQPDILLEVTKKNRGAWKWLLGASPATVVVRQHLGETWVFNETRFLHITRQDRQIKGAWVDGRNVVDAASDPTRGLVLQLSDGSLAIVGQFLTDGGTDLGGTNGGVPSWFYRTGIRVLAHGVVRTVAHVDLGPDGVARIDIEGDREESPATAIIEGEGRKPVSKPLARAAGGGNLFSVSVAGLAADRVLSVSVDLTERDNDRQLNNTP